MIVTEYKQRIARSFEQAVDSYDKTADLQHVIGNQLIKQLSSFSHSFNIVVDVGAGTGHLTPLLKRLAPQAYYLLVDLAYALLASYSPSEDTSTQALCADFDYLPLLSNSVDLLFSSMSLQWSLNFPQTLMELLRCVKPGGLLAIAFPVEGTLAELAKTHRVNPFFSVAQVDQTLKSADVSVLLSEKKNYEKSYPDLLGLLRFLRSTGANCYLPQAGFRPEKLKFQRNNIQANFHIYFLILEKR